MSQIDPVLSAYARNKCFVLGFVGAVSGPFLLWFLFEPAPGMNRWVMGLAGAGTLLCGMRLLRRAFGWRKLEG